MADNIIAIAFIIVLFIGIPVLILWLRDRSKFAGGIVTRLFGLVTLLSGVALLIFIFYSFFKSTPSFGAESLKYLFWLLFPIGFIAFGWKWLNDSGPGIEDHNIDFDSPELITSVEKAKATLPFFIDNVKKHMDGAYLKFPFQTDEDITEHVWAYVHHYENRSFNVSMVNEPYSQKGEYEQRVDVPEKDVEDWQIMYPDGKIKGGYSYIGALEYLERKGIRFNRTLTDQKNQLIDAEPTREL